MSLGFIILLLAFLLNAYSIWAGTTGIKFNSKSLLRYTRKTTYGQFVLVTFSVALLLYALLSRDFTYRYVAEYSDRHLPLLYTISALYAGQAGSLLFWAWLLTIFNSMFVFFTRKKESELQPYVITIVNVVAFFFLSLVIYSSNPFEKLSHPLPDGYGLNPLLQNPEMIFHPPMLFLGFVGFTIPFAFALAALMKGDLSSKWINESRNWSLFAWIALTIGNLLGAQWAYVELGWGGYWAWDPVENASLLPWLTGTAFIHSIMAQRSLKMMKAWNVSLAIVTFLLTILGTFITRSGIISSVHAFGKSNMGTLFLIFMGLIFIVSLSLIIRRRSSLKPEEKISSFLSREFSFLLNNFILVILTVTVLWGTLYPAITELFIGKQITLGQEFFNKISIPFGIALFLLLAICPLLFWRLTKKELVFKRTVISFSLTIIFIATVYFLGVKHINSLIVLGIAFLAVIVIISDFLQSSVTRKKNNQLSLVKSLTEELSVNTRKYAAYVIHLGVVMIFIAIVGTTAYKVEKQVTLKKGEATTLGKYTLVYTKMGEHYELTKDVFFAEIDIYQNEKKIGTLTPERFLYKSGIGERQVTTEVDLRSNLIEDLYVSLASYQSDESATFVLMLNPLQNWLWIGGIVMTIGVIIIFIDVSRKKNKKSTTPSKK